MCGIGLIALSCGSRYAIPFVRIPPYEKENKVSSGAEDNAKSVEMGTYKAGHRSDLSGGQSSVRVGKF